jgi:lariat debranching enzyme
MRRWARQIAVEGCCHGELDTIYAAMQRLEAKEGVQIDLLICCGDFQARSRVRAAWPSQALTRGAQAVRNEDDLACMSVPDKYKVLGTFYKARAPPARAAEKAGVARDALTAGPRAQYYTGEAVAPYPTLFIGGNHEACNYLWEARSAARVLLRLRPS